MDNQDYLGMDFGSPCPRIQSRVTADQDQIHPTWTDALGLSAEEIRHYRFQTVSNM